MADASPPIDRKLRKRLREELKLSRQLLKKHTGALADEERDSLRAVHSDVQTCLDANDGNGIAAVAQRFEELDAAYLQRFRKHPLRESLEGIGIAIIIALFLRTFILEAFTIPSGSMIPTLAVGDFLFVNKLSYGVRIPVANRLVVQWGEPVRGDVIVFVYPCNNEQDYIKRVVGVPGDVVDVDANGFLTLNGVPAHGNFKGLFEDLDAYSGTDRGSNGCLGPTRTHVVDLEDTSFRALHCGPAHTAIRREGVPNDWSGFADYRSCGDPLRGPGLVPRFPWRVPQGHFFVMGDNRGNSADSRYWGFVPMSHIKGRSMFIWMSWDGSAELAKPWTKVRWERLFRRVHSL